VAKEGIQQLTEPAAPASGAAGPSPTSREAAEPPASRRRPAVAGPAVAAVAAGFAGLMTALFLGGAAFERVIPGLWDPGILTRWGLPALRLAMDLTATLAVGALLCAAVLLPSDHGRLHPAAPGCLRAASWLAAAWAAAAGGTLIFTVSDVKGAPVAEVIAGNELSSFAGQLPQGIALMLVILLAGLVALFARTAQTPGAAAWLLVLALVTLLPPPLTGHAAAAANHSVAVTGLAIHVVALAPWVGGLAVLGWYARRSGPAFDHAPGVHADHPRTLSVATARYSRMALWCFAAVGVSGVANMMARLPGPRDLVLSPYGRLVIIKIIAFCLLGWLGWRHRTRTLPAVAAGRPRAFARLAAVEVAVLAATAGVAVALARTAPPPPIDSFDPVRELLGYAMPPPVTVARLAGLWRFELFFAVVAALAAGLYLAGVVRLRRRGDRWPPGRTATWLAGLVTLVIATMSGVATYAPVLFSVHMAQHMVLSMLTPILLVLGAPVTLALRALRPAAVRGDRGPREWLTAILHSRAIRLLSHPAVAAGIFVASAYAVYFTPLFGALMFDHLGHLVMLGHFLLSGALFFWVLIGVDPAPRTVPYFARLITLFLTMPFHAFFGIALMNSGPIAPVWYDALRRPWGAAALADQHTGGAIAWAFGEIPTFIVIIVLVFQWAMADERLARRIERRADRADRAAARADADTDTDADADADELTAYNAYLAGLDRRSRGSGGGRGEA
jgi:cytochrome c oxidase assembly factor CtaG/putative copper export protein